MVRILSSLLRVGTEPDEYLSNAQKTPRGPDWRASVEETGPDPTVLQELSKITEKATLVCFCAHWCKDCVKHIPNLVANLQKAKNPNLRLVMLDYDQNRKLAEEAGVSAIPTLIIFGANGSETGRIIEDPSPPYRSFSEELMSKLTSKK